MKNTDTAGHKGYDAGKKVSGIKRHIAVDTQGLPHAIHVTTANVTDRAGALAMFDRRRDGLSQVQNVLVDGGYTGKPFATAVQGLLGASVEVVKRSELHTFVVLPKRWVVERSFAWLEKCRRLWKNCERKLNTSLQMVVLAFTVLILKRLQTGSYTGCAMIQGYRDRRTAAFAAGEFVPAFQGFEDQAARRLSILNAARSVDTLRALRGNRLEVLRGDRAGQYSIRINRQWRICFSWPDGQAGPSGVEIVDYH